ncbi:hypothetical protein BJ956_002109 [Arthrobacter psychrochitiniphilus]|nr:hypothetical protein [Arthrobacter psychrochitiniphilus]
MIAFFRDTANGSAMPTKSATVFMEEKVRAG